ncbi:MAG: helix-turn-helix transcriptional regulator [Polyangiaceae bacterium]|nr:helix-turn-helix transcriptional regulator [Polyangiaceae bacterium]
MGSELSRLRLLASDADAMWTSEQRSGHAVWFDLLENRLSTVACFTDRSRHYVILRECSAGSMDLLSRRETTILIRVLLGRTGKSISEETGLAGSTVATYCASTLRKLGIRCREHAVPLSIVMRVEYNMLSGQVSDFQMGSVSYVVVSAPLSDTQNSSLTAAQKRVLRLLLAGASNADIARDCRTCLHTAENHVASVFRKLGVNNRFRLVDHALCAAEHSDEQPSSELGRDQHALVQQRAAS